MAFLSDDDRRRIENAIRAAEKRTSGEIVTVIARASHHYALVSLLGAVIAALLVPPCVWLWASALPNLGFFAALPSFIGWTSGRELGYLQVYEMQLAVFVIVALLLSWRPIGMRLVPAALKNRHARRLAREQFHALRLHETKAGTGILIFVSIAERYVEILADHGIHARVPDGTWANIVADFTAKVRAGRIVDGFISAIAACSAQLAEHFPRVADDRDELSDAVVEV